MRKDRTGGGVKELSYFVFRVTDRGDDGDANVRETEIQPEQTGEGFIGVLCFGDGVSGISPSPVGYLPIL